MADYNRPGNILVYHNDAGYLSFNFFHIQIIRDQKSYKVNNFFIWHSLYYLFTFKQVQTILVGGYRALLLLRHVILTIPPIHRIKIKKSAFTYSLDRCHMPTYRMVTDFTYLSCTRGSHTGWS